MKFAIYWYLRLICSVYQPGSLPLIKLYKKSLSGEWHATRIPPEELKILQEKHNGSDCRLT